MLIYNIEKREGISKKTGNHYDATVISGLTRRFNGGIQAVDVWVENNCPDLKKISVGDQVRIAQDAGSHYIINLNDPCQDELSKLLAKIL